jgi:hypothetical protein
MPARRVLDERVVARGAGRARRWPRLDHCTELLERPVSSSDAFGE